MPSALDAGRLETVPVGEITDDFFVPAYQRGYRWGVHEVKQLLNDMRVGLGGSYYLQPVVVKLRDDGSWELIHGQQRLTTLYLIFQYIQREHFPAAKPNYSITYETRPGSKEYLERLAPADAETRYYMVKYPGMRENGSSTYFSERVDETEPVSMGYSLCMLRAGGKALSGYHRDPYLLAITQELDDQDVVKDEWFIGYEDGTSSAPTHEEWCVNPFCPRRPRVVPSTWIIGFYGFRDHLCAAGGSGRRQPRSCVAIGR